jgi:prepilin-type N-terminal cleavage/methylation domain-containing protein
MIKNWKKGFTLIELIVVIAIIAILSMIMIPGLFNYIETTNNSVDMANLRTLNTATSLYKVEAAPNGDLFDGFSSDLSRQSKLVELSYIREIVSPRKSGANFYWSIDKQVWEYSESVLAIDSSSHYVFRESLLDDYRRTGTWRKTEDGFVSGNGLLFIPNPEEEYSISSVAKLLEGTNGGYGLLIETSLTESNRDSGYSIQLDRGLGGVVIRKRTDTRESNVITTVYNRNNGIIPASRSDAWWTEEHTLKVDVRNSSNPAKKIITVYLNNTPVITNFEIDANPNPDANFAGLRSWGGNEVTYKDVEINK